MCSMSRVCVACSTAPAPRNSQPLEHGMIDGVIQPRNERQRRQQRMTYMLVIVMQEHQRRAETHQDDADVLDACDRPAAVSGRVAFKAYNTPSTAETVPMVSTVTPHHIGGLPRK